MRLSALVLCVALAGPSALAGQASPSAADQALRARVEAALRSAADLPADSIGVEVAGGIVTLVGSVACEGCGGNATPGGSATVQQSLGAVVRAVPGVDRVIFRLRYGPG